jgi:Ca-activated chloride channel family protein
MKYRCAAVLATPLILASLHAHQPPAQTPDGTSFKSAVELIHVNVTVLDSRGQFVPGLRLEDFAVYEDDEPQTVTQFTAGRVPVSLGMAVDTSASMVGEKMQLAKRALDSLLYDLFGSEDEFFLDGFSDHPVLLQGWTSDRNTILRSLDRIVLGGRTALYDVVAEAIPRAQQGRNIKKALVLVSDGNDNRSSVSVEDVKQLIRENDALVYAIGIDCGKQRAPTPPPRRHQIFPTPLPFSFPRCPDPLNVLALREMTDATGGRTAIIDNPRDLERTTGGIADELSKQYDLGYSSSGKTDGRWHAIRVELRTHSYQVRARRGYLARSQSE